MILILLIRDICKCLKKEDMNFWNFLWPVEIIIVYLLSLCFQSNMEQMSHHVKEEVEVKTDIESIYFPAELVCKEEEQQVK